jgi:hypothetical protein
MKSKIGLGQFGLGVNTTTWTQESTNTFSDSFSRCSSVTARGTQCCVRNKARYVVRTWSTAFLQQVEHGAVPCAQHSCVTETANRLGQ